MNAIEGAYISTIHVTPKDGFSYARLEAVGYNLKEVNLTLPEVLICFKTKDFSIEMHATNAVLY